MSAYPFHYDMPALCREASEIAVQKQCLGMIARAFPLTRVAAVPNGQKRTRWQQQQAKREGMSKGFLDLVIVGQSRRQIHSELSTTDPIVAFCEIKAGGSMTTEQKDWLQFLTDCGHKCGVFRTPETLAAKMKEWGFR